MTHTRGKKRGKKTRLRKVSKQISAANEPPKEEKYRLEVFCEPEEVFYAEEHGNASYLFAAVVLRSNVVQPGLAAKCSVEPKLCFADSRLEVGNRVLQGRRKLRQVFTIVNRPYATVLDKASWATVVEFRVDGLISKHVNSRKFVLKIEVSGPNGIFHQAYTRSFEVRTKRKLVKAHERNPEIEARKRVERNVYRILHERLPSLRSPEYAKEEFFVKSIHQILELDRLEKAYPSLPSKYSALEPQEPEGPSQRKRARSFSDGPQGDDAKKKQRKETALGQRTGEIDLDATSDLDDCLETESLFASMCDNATCHFEVDL